MTLVEVHTAADERDFLTVHILLNQHNPSWIRPLDKDIKQVFDPRRNKAFRNGEVIRWVLKKTDGTLAGRIAAFVNTKYKNKGDDMSVGGIGFFDCIHDQDCANLLFNAAKGWLKNKGMEAMDGPINFGERDRWWGLLIKGFQPPLYTMNYNPPYYQQLFENFGFKNFYNQICWTLPVAGASQQLQPKFYESHKKWESEKGIKAITIKKNKLEKFAMDFSLIYNKAWAAHEGNKEIKPEQAIHLFKMMKPVMDEELVWFTYHNNEPIAMWISIPDINQIVRHLNGKFNIISKLKFLYYKSIGVCDRFIGIIFGVVPEFQGSGIDYYMIVEAEKVIKRSGRYKQTELQWQGDFNPKILGISKNLGAEESRVLVTYRFLFDPNKPFNRHPIIG